MTSRDRDKKTHVLTMESQAEERPVRQRPAHMPPVERHNQPIIVLVTLCIRPRIDALANETFHDVFLAAAADADAWSCGFYTIMPDHIHVFACPASEPAAHVRRWASYLKERIGKRHSHPEWKWQTDCWDRQMRDSTHYHDRWEYVRQNPVRAGLIETPEEWPYKGVIHELRW